MVALSSKTDPVPAAGAVVARSGGLRRAVVLALVVAATVVALASVLAVWVQRQVLDTDVYVRASAAMLDDPAVRTAVANYAVDEVYRRVDVEAELEDVLPNDADRFADLAAAALRPAAYQVVDRALRTSVLAGLWETTNREAHEQFVRTVVGGGGDGVSTEGGVVRLGLRPILVESTRRIGLGESLAARIPADAGTVEVLRSDELKAVQDAMWWLDAVAKVLPFVALGLYALALWLARDRRREALRNTGIGLVVGAGLLLLTMGALRGIVLDRVAGEPQARDAASAVWRIVESPLNGALWAVVALGAVLAFGAVLAGPGRHATALRRSLAPYLEWRGFVIGLGTAVAALLVLAGAIDSFLRLALARHLRGARRLRDRGPPASGAARVPRGRATSTRRLATGALGQPERPRSKRRRGGPLRAGGSGRKGLRRAKRRRVRPASPASALADPRPPSPSLDDLERLERLGSLHKSGVLTDEEFATMKTRLVEP